MDIDGVLNMTDLFDNFNGTNYNFSFPYINSSLFNYSDSSIRELFDYFNGTSYNFSVPFINSSIFNWINVSFENKSFDPMDWPNITYEVVSPVQGAAKYICYVFYVLVLFFGIFGNMLVFYVIGYRKKKRNSGDIFILSLACADFLASLGVAMIYVNGIITGFSGWVYGKELCYILPGISQTTTCASGWFLVLISLDRYR